MATQSLVWYDHTVAMPLQGLPVLTAILWKLSLRKVVRHDPRSVVEIQYIERRLLCMISDIRVYYTVYGTISKLGYETHSDQSAAHTTKNNVRL